MREKIVLITGGTDGIGLETAKQLSKTGSTVVITARDVQKGEKAVAEIAAFSGNKNTSYLTADLSSQRQVRELAEKFRQNHHRLDVLINNAGVFHTGLKYSEDGIEMQLAVNHLAGFLLTHLLLDLLKKSAPARIINVSSDASFRGSIRLDNLNMDDDYNGFKAYRQSKLANVMFTYELAERLAGSRITVNCLNPGGVNTKIGQAHAGGWTHWAWRLARPFFLSVQKGAETSVYLASAPELENVTGKYFEKCRPVKSAELSYDKALVKKLWEASERLTATKPG